MGQRCPPTSGQVFKRGGCIFELMRRLQQCHSVRSTKNYHCHFVIFAEEAMEQP
jgi:hypothetical protein